MVPVEQTKTVRRGTPRHSAVICAIRRASFIPAAPVHAFAHPLLTTTALAVPPRKCSLHNLTGAAHTRFRVNTPATDAGRSETSSAMSSREYRIPAHTADARYPRAAVTPPSIVFISHRQSSLAPKKQATLFSIHAELSSAKPTPPEFEKNFPSSHIHICGVLHVPAALSPTSLCRETGAPDCIGSPIRRVVKSGHFSNTKAGLVERRIRSLNSLVFGRFTSYE